MAGRNVKTNRTMYTRRPGPAPKKSRVKPNTKLVIWLIEAGVAVLAIMGLWHIFAITTFKVLGNRTVPAADIIREAETSFNHHPFSRNLVTLGLAPLSDDISADQRFSDVQVKSSWPGTVVITVVERQIGLAWKSANNLYALDSNGVVVAPLEVVGSKLPVVTDSTGLPVKVGDRVVSGRFITFVLGVSQNLTPKTGLRMVDMSVPETTSELNVKTAAGFVVKFDTTGGVEEELTNLKTVLNTLSNLKKTPAQYIDLRVANKAYYL